jgi:hypothetical protein
MAEIIVNLTDGVANIQQQGFGIPAVYGETEQFNVLKTGTGKNQLVFRSESRGEAFSVEIVQGVTLAFTATGSKVTLTLPTGGATAKQCKANFDASAPSQVTDLVTLTLANSGSALVTTLTETNAAQETEFVLTDANDVADLLPYYLSTDKEYLMASALFNQALKPEKAYVFNAFEDTSSVDFATKILEFDNQDFYFLLLTSTVKADIVEAATWADLNDKLLVALCEDETVLDEVESFESPAVIITADDTERKDAMIVGVQAPKLPGSTAWAWKQATGATAEADDGLIEDTIAANGNVFLKKSGLTIFADGRMANGLFISQKHSRDYVKARIAERIAGLLASVEKLPYDDTGISQLVSALSDQLNAFGDGGIIARAVSSTEMETSFNGVYQYSITAPMRAQVIVNNPSNITAGLYEFSCAYVEAGEIVNVTVNVKILLKLS